MIQLQKGTHYSGWPIDTPIAQKKDCHIDSPCSTSWIRIDDCGIVKSPCWTHGWCGTFQASPIFAVHSQTLIVLPLSVSDCFFRRLHFPQNIFGLLVFITYTQRIFQGFALPYISFQCSFFFTIQFQSKEVKRSKSEQRILEAPDSSLVLFSRNLRIRKAASLVRCASVLARAIFIIPVSVIEQIVM